MMSRTICCVVGIVGIYLSSIVPLKAKAQSRITYIPPKQDKEKPQESQSSATRGCRQDLTEVVTLIAPEAHQGLTTLAQPILFYSVAQKVSSPALLTVAEINGRSALVESKIDLSEPGIKTFKFPSKVLLENNQDYLWTITIVCNPKRPSDSVEVQTTLKRVPIEAELARQLAQAKTPRQKSYYSALSGLWYDSLYHLSFLVPEQAQSDFQDLLEQINLKVSED